MAGMHRSQRLICKLLLYCLWPLPLPGRVVAAVPGSHNQQLASADKQLQLIVTQGATQKGDKVSAASR